jgi:phosphomannomutase
MNTASFDVTIRQIMDQSGVRFGTSGARGLAADMTAPVCFAYTAAFLRVVAPPTGSRVALGLDLRPSSPDIAGACAAAIRQAGLIPDFCGVLPTPALAYYAQEQGIPAIMVTGSHIPFDRNGIKFYRATGEITKADEAGIAAATVALPGDAGPAPLPEANPAARELYARRYLDFFPAGILAGLRLGFYEHSSVARDQLRDILEALGAEVTSLGRTDQFVPIDTEAVGEEDVARARQWSETQGFDALLSTDGDADRPLIGDERGEWLRGDVVGILCARYLGAPGRGHAGEQQHRAGEVRRLRPHRCAPASARPTSSRAWSGWRRKGTRAWWASRPTAASWWAPGWKRPAGRWPPCPPATRSCPSWRCWPWPGNRACPCHACRPNCRRALPPAIACKISG